MSLLDKLDLEVERIESDRRDRENALNEQEIYYQTHLKPIMVKAHTYFSELVDKLKVVNPEIRPTYPLITKTRSNVTFDQSNYRYYSDDAENPGKVDILCDCCLTNPLEFSHSSQAAVLRQSELLNNYNVPHHQKNTLDSFYEIRAATFILEGPLTVQIRIRACAVDKCIYITLKNLEDRPLRRYTFAPESIDQALFERLAKVLIREEEKLVDMKVDAALRKNLQDQIERERLMKKNDISKALMAEQAEIAEKESSKKLDVIERVQDAAARLSKLISPSRKR